MKRFADAFRGLAFAVRTEKHMRIHLCFAFYVVLGGLVVGLAAAEWAAVLICCGAVLCAECLNTALERLCDRVTTEKSELIRAAKDAAAGGVLVCSVFAAAAGCVIFFGKDRPLAAFEFFAGRPALAVLLALSLVIWILMIFGRNKK